MFLLNNLIFMYILYYFVLCGDGVCGTLWMGFGWIKKLYIEIIECQVKFDYFDCVEYMIWL